jgi:curved DNA-binding protein CbpA
MSQNSLSKEWLKLIIDPYAMLGISVNADERQISKRYYVLAKQLHPDQRINNNNPDRELAEIVFTQLINPAYEQLKQRKKRSSVIALLRSGTKALDQQKAVAAKMSIIQTMSTMTAQEAELFYEDVVKSYASAQYHSLQRSYQLTQQLSALNIVYLSCQQIENLPGNQPQAITDEEDITEIQSDQDETTLLQNNSSSNTILQAELINYAKRHYERAVEYSHQEKWNLAVGELRDAIKLDVTNSDYYALLGVVHFNQKFIGMAKVYIRQALKMNPQQPLALKYAELLHIKVNETVAPKSIVKALGIASLLSRFLSKK